MITTEVSAAPGTTAELVERARGGDALAWANLVTRYTPFLYRIARSFGLSRASSSDVVQTAWLRFVEHQAELRTPGAVSGWLATTARRESLALQRRERASVDLGPQDAEPTEPGPSVEEQVVRSNNHAVLAQALDRIPARDRQLLAMLTAFDGASYADVAIALGMPIGSIGPTRARALARLRRELEAMGMTEFDLAG